jgi:hypothetical protein
MTDQNFGTLCFRPFILGPFPSELNIHYRKNRVPCQKKNTATPVPATVREQNPLYTKKKHRHIRSRNGARTKSLYTKKNTATFVPATLREQMWLCNTALYILHHVASSATAAPTRRVRFRACIRILAFPSATLRRCDSCPPNHTHTRPRPSLALHARSQFSYRALVSWPPL